MTLAETITGLFWWTFMMISWTAIIAYERGRIRGRDDTIKILTKKCKPFHQPRHAMFRGQ